MVMQPRVVNAKRHGRVTNSEWAYVGRPTKWGNPFVIGKDGSREQVIEKHRAWIETQPQLLAALDELRGKHLICHCAPLPCHGDILLKLANKPQGNQMTDVFKSPCPPPTPYENEILTKLIQEMSEVTQRVTKMMLFGVEEVQPGQDASNRIRLSRELGDLACIIALANENNLIDPPTIQEWSKSHRKQFAKYSQHMPDDVRKKLLT
jgi:hypothetical protein